MSSAENTQAAGETPATRYPEPAFDPNDEWEDDDSEDDDDMDYEPAEEELNDDDALEEELLTIGESDDNDFTDAQEDLNGVQVEFEIDESGEPVSGRMNLGGGDEQQEGGQGERHLYITREQIMQLLGHAGLRQIFADHGTARRRAVADDDDDSEPDTGYGGASRRPRRKRGSQAFEKVPSEVGRQLMEEGTFGTNDRDTYNHVNKRRKRLAYQVMQRELGQGNYGKQKSADNLAVQNLLPGTNADSIIHYDARCYSGQFSDDGNFFFSCAQDFKVRMYDTSNPYHWKYYKTVYYPNGQWTITDASLSADNRFLAYSSIRSIVCLAPTDPESQSEPYLLDFSTMSGRGSRRGFYSHNYFGIYSLRFSGDGREIVAGTGDHSVYVYDLETRQSVLRIQGHTDDVNAVCYGDSSSPHILYSGSDDTTIKVWDRRSLGDGREAGVFLGHTEGLTYVDSKGDGRYVLSNGKDQTAKLWDLRKMMPPEKLEDIDVSRYTTNFEYRTDTYDPSSWRPHAHDCSLVTFRGHAVLKTLIRCHFSPPGSTDSRYVYSGSQDGKVHIWNMDATPAGTVDVFSATKNSRPRDQALLDETDYFIGRNGSGWQTLVRDASWHPTAPVIAATSWNGWGTSMGTATVHSWNDGMEDDEGEPPMGRRVNARMEYDEDLYKAPVGGRRSYFGRRRRAAAAMQDDDDE